MRALGENLREHKLRRLSAKTIALAELVETARAKGDEFDHLAYAELLGDLLLTARKLEKHVGGEAIEERHVEELIGKTWTKKDRAPVTGLDLVEVAFLQRELTEPVDVERIVAGARNKEEAVEIYAASLMAIRSDTPQEREYLATLASRLKLEPGLVESIEKTVDAVAVK